MRQCRGATWEGTAKVGHCTEDAFHVGVAARTRANGSKGQRVERGRPHEPPGTLSIHGRIVNFYSQLPLAQH